MMSVLCTSLAQHSLLITKRLASIRRQICLAAMALQAWVGLASTKLQGRDGAVWP